MDRTVRLALPLIRSCGTSARLRTAPAAVLASALLAFAFGGCETAPSSDAAISASPIRSDSAGIELVDYPSLPPIEASRIAIADEPDLVLGDGGSFVGPEYEFFRIRGVSQLRDGTLVVAQQGSNELRLYGADGHFLRLVGSSGDGPGEFRRLWGHWIVEGDTIVSWDQQVRRLQHFTRDGALIRSTSIPMGPSTGFPNMGAPDAIRGVLEGGRVAVFASPFPSATEGPERRPSLLALHRIDDGGWDSVRVVPGPEVIFDPVGEGNLRRREYTFGEYPVAAGFGAIMAVADAGRFRVKLFNPDGHLVSIISASVPEVPVTADVIDGQVEHLVAHATGAAAGHGPERAAYEETMRRSVLARHAPFLPEIRDVFVDADERIWVERYDVPGRSPSRWEVFAPDGTWVGRVEIPAGFARGRRVELAPGFSVASGRLAGVWTDPETGVETVRVYRVIEPVP